jgi:hypothetical protein
MNTPVPHHLAGGGVTERSGSAWPAGWRVNVVGNRVCVTTPRSSKSLAVRDGPATQARKDFGEPDIRRGDHVHGGFATWVPSRQAIALKG